MGLAAGLCIAGGAQAAEYACAPWAGPDQGVPALATISVGKSMITYRGDSGPSVTARMAHSTLTRRIYPEDDSLFVIHGDFVRGPDGPEFGPRITVQRLMHDAATPILATTTCEAR